MEHNFVWTSKDIEGIPNRLVVGMELADGHLKTWNLNPEKEEYLMAEEPLNPEFDTATMTADWFTASLEVTNHNTTYLKVRILNPALDLAPTEEDFSHCTNLQLDEDRYRWELVIDTHKDILDPAIFEMLNRHR